MKRTSLYLSVAAVLLVGALVFNEGLRSAYEVAEVRLFSSAERAYTYGERHFNAKDPSAYNVELAEYFFWESHSLDPELPFVYHQISRIAFLKGEFDAALKAIDVQIRKHPDVSPSSYYMRGLILGYMGRYDEAAGEYAKYLTHDPNNWAALNDYAWVLLKAGRVDEAKEATAKGLVSFPGNAWLLNTHAIALYELGETEEALRSVEAAAEAVESVTEGQWLTAYPGNDPDIAREGIATLKKSIAENMHTIQAASASGAVESR